MSKYSRKEYKELKKLDVSLTFRLFSVEYANLQKVVRYTLIDNWERKYDSESTFVRCAVNQLIRKELPFISAVGRPRKA